MENSLNLTNILFQAVNKQLENELDKHFEEHIKQLNEKKNEIIAGVLLNIMGKVEMSKIGENYTFTIKELKTP